MIDSLFLHLLLFPFLLFFLFDHFLLLLFLHFLLLLFLFFFFQSDLFSLSLPRGEVGVVFSLDVGLDLSDFLCFQLGEVYLYLLLLRLQKGSLFDDLPYADEVGCG